MTQPIEASAADFESLVLRSDVPVLVDFWAPWCGPCRMMAPILDQVAREMEGKMKVVKVNVEEPVNLDLAQQYEIRSIPNMKLFRKGQVVQEVIGMRSKDMLMQELGS